MKGKVLVCASLIKLHAMRRYGGGGHSSTILDLGIIRRWSVSRRGLFTPGIHWAEGWVASITDLDA
jgi:hypothetical protein